MTISVWTEDGKQDWAAGDPMPAGAEMFKEEFIEQFKEPFNACRSAMSTYNDMAYLGGEDWPIAGISFWSDYEAFWGGGVGELLFDGIIFNWTSPIWLAYEGTHGGVMQVNSARFVLNGDDSLILSAPDTSLYTTQSMFNKLGLHFVKNNWGCEFPWRTPNNETGSDYIGSEWGSAITGLTNGGVIGGDFFTDLRTFFNGVACLLVHDIDDVCKGSNEDWLTFKTRVEHHRSYHRYSYYDGDDVFQDSGLEIENESRTKFMNDVDGIWNGELTYKATKPYSSDTKMSNFILNVYKSDILFDPSLFFKGSLSWKTYDIVSPDTVNGIPPDKLTLRTGGSVSNGDVFDTGWSKLLPTVTSKTRATSYADTWEIEGDRDFSGYISLRYHSDFNEDWI
ncbi:MAG: hypothetical protein EOM12_13515 [Verrucomicrobiae bacterium]|nr:hypothetical protein [Verrucomicrobiae bacterium]